MDAGEGRNFIPRAGGVERNRFTRGEEFCGLMIYASSITGTCGHIMAVHERNMLKQDQLSISCTSEL